MDTSTSRRGAIKTAVAVVGAGVAYVAPSLRTIDLVSVAYASGYAGPGRSNDPGRKPQ